jgi:hypothetical protein
LVHVARSVDGADIYRWRGYDFAIAGGLALAAASVIVTAAWVVAFLVL